MLAWLARALEANAERNKLQMNPRLAASHSFFASLAAVLLRLCDPFLEPLSGKAWGKLDPGCVWALPFLCLEKPLSTFPTLLSSLRPKGSSQRLSSEAWLFMGSIMHPNHVWLAACGPLAGPR
jgi:hypothetical protein